MAVLQANNIQTGSPEGAKYVQVGTILEIWTVSTTTALANGDTILGPSLPANCYLEDVTVDITKIDNGSSSAFTVGIAGTPAAYISSSTAGQTGGIARMNVPGAFGSVNLNSNVQTVLTVTATAGIPVAGTVKIGISYTASP